MKQRIILFAIFVTFFFIPREAFPQNSNQINFSLTLSGHILLGIGYSHEVADHHLLQATFFFIPAKGFPFAVNGGYNYYFKGDKWQPNLGLEAVLIVSPPDPKKRKYLPLLNFTPGIRFNFNETNFINSRLWLSYFPIKAKIKFAPTGIEFKYGRFF